MSSEFENTHLEMCKRIEVNLLAEAEDGEYQKRQQQKRIERKQKNQRIIEEYNSKLILKAEEAKIKKTFI
jgi:hypothetical protein